MVRLSAEVEQKRIR